jgi:D-arginine dehydrogenase
MHYDIAIIGSGIAGASLAWHLGRSAKVLLLEGEAYPGYHATGRSAAFYAQTYGGALVQPLTIASAGFFHTPPEGFCQTPLVHARGALHVAAPGQEATLQALYARYQPASPEISMLDAAQARSLAPALKPEAVARALWEPGCLDIDVAALHQGFLSGAKRLGVQLACDQRVLALNPQGAHWEVVTRTDRYQAGSVVNAAGAWGDVIAKMAGIKPLGLVPKRRSMIAFKPEKALENPAQPVVLDVGEHWYFKPQSGMVWASPADETPMSPCDVQPDILDIAQIIERMHTVSHHKIVHLAQRWAGLRTFAPDRVPVYGMDQISPNFYWCVGQGGFGIQTAPAAGALLASQILGTALPAILQKSMLDPTAYAPSRFANVYPNQ